MKRLGKQILTMMMAVVLAAGAVPLSVQAEIVDTNENEVIRQSSIPRGKLGKSMNVTLQIQNESSVTWSDIVVYIENHGRYFAGAEEIGMGYVFPFERTASTTLAGSIAPGSHRNVSIPVKVRADLPEGYYTVWVSVEGEGVSVQEAINVYLSAAASGNTSDTEDINKQISFTLGEGEATPYGVYPNIMNYSINMRNTGLSDALDVRVQMVLDKDTEVFPFDINDGNYDRRFEKVAAGETVALPYSMAIRADAYSGFYPIGFVITYRESATGDVRSQEDTFWVRIKNKEKEDRSGEFDEHSSSMARIVVDSFDTIPESIISGEPFQLMLRMKNASADIPASNILLDLKSETASSGGGAVFTTQSGSSSYVVNSLNPGEVTELILDMKSMAGIDPRTYTLTIGETYDSPDYKNAKAEVSINIPVSQIARLNTGTIDVMPDNINVGSDTNIMFPINNTGKVILYNVMVAFEADSVAYTDTYVGNIEPAQTGNVDAMVTGIAGTMDDGKVKIIITYENEYGEVQDPVEKELTLFVNDFSEDYYDNIMAGDFEDVPMEPEPAGIGRYAIYIGAAAVVVAGIVAGTLIIRRRKKKKASEEEIEDEIS